MIIDAKVLCSNSHEIYLLNRELEKYIKMGYDLRGDMVVSPETRSTYPQICQMVVLLDNKEEETL